MPSSIPRSHVVSIYRPLEPVDDPYAPPAGTFDAVPIAADVPANLQALTGSVQDTAAGREIGATWKGFVPPGTPVDEDYGITVLSGYGSRRFRVRQVGEQGAGWDTELMLAETAEAIP